MLAICVQQITKADAKTNKYSADYFSGSGLGTHAQRAPNEFLSKY